MYVNSKTAKSFAHDKRFRAATCFTRTARLPWGAVATAGRHSRVRPGLAWDAVIAADRKKVCMIAAGPPRKCYLQLCKLLAIHFSPEKAKDGNTLNPHALAGDRTHSTPGMLFAKRYA